MAKEEEKEEQPAPKSKKKLIMVGGLGVLLLAGGVAAAVMMLKGGDGEDEAKSTADEISEDAGGEGGHGGAKSEDKGEPKLDSHGNPIEDGSGGGSDDDSGPPWIHPFSDPFTVNLFEPTNRWFLQMYLQIETSSPEVLKSIDRNIAPLRDTIILLLSSKTKKELSTMDGKLKLKQEIVIRIEAVLGKGSVKTVYFTEFTIMTM